MDFIAPPNDAPPAGAWIRLADLRAQWLAELELGLRAFIMDECGLSEAAFDRALKQAGDQFDAYAAKVCGRLH